MEVCTREHLLLKVSVHCTDSIIGAFDMARGGDEEQHLQKVLDERVSHPHRSRDGVHKQQEPKVRVG